MKNVIYTVFAAGLLFLNCGYSSADDASTDPQDGEVATAETSDESSSTDESSAADEENKSEDAEASDTAADE